MKVTMSVINGRLELINKMLKHIGSSDHIKVEHRYDYYAMDTYDADGNIRRTIKAGMTKQQVHDSLLFIEEVIHMVPDP